MTSETFDFSKTEVFDDFEDFEALEDFEDFEEDDFEETEDLDEDGLGVFSISKARLGCVPRRPSNLSSRFNSFILLSTDSTVNVAELSELFLTSDWLIVVT